MRGGEGREGCEERGGRDVRRRGEGGMDERRRGRDVRRRGEGEMRGGEMRDGEGGMKG